MKKEFRQNNVWQMMRDGISVNRIAGTLGVSRGTVYNDIKEAPFLVKIIYKLKRKFIKN